ncbi:hypothetical protein CHS0354_023884 [Potamilus streckersoni]|uniref:Uncharacterized protein n=1 Tax=Potamilus streckersoni TaxID=2493646 RepID=A0AAE0RZ65_9BIVA|nr:hypothetical protein CHS0354_023884 [Potamilus streckersoni]
MEHVIEIAEKNNIDVRIGTYNDIAFFDTIEKAHETEIGSMQNADILTYGTIKKAREQGQFAKNEPLSEIHVRDVEMSKHDKTPCVKIERQYKDLIYKVTLGTRSDFVEKLTHDSFVVQVERIRGEYSTRLDKLLSVFEQSHFVDERRIVKEYMHETDIEEVQLMTKILRHSGTNSEEKKKIEIEQEAWRTVDAMFAEKEKALLQKIEERDKALEEKDEVLGEKYKALEEKDKALGDKDKLIAELMKRFNEKK